MIPVGTEILGQSGAYYTVKRALNPGGQAEAYVCECPAGVDHVAKLFHPHFHNRETRQRIDFLVKGGLAGLSEVICAPIDVIDHNGLLGHVAPCCGGDTLEDLLSTNTLTFLDGIEVAIQLAHAFAVLHENAIAHGDAQSLNAMCEPMEDAFVVKLIDLDNFVNAGLPAPPCLGQHYYLAPELRSNRQSHPTISTDLYALAVMIHEVLLRKHPCFGFNSTVDEFHQAMLQGFWLGDPSRMTGRAEPAGGYSVRSLDASLTRLFRRALTDAPDTRPSALAWRDVLRECLHKVVVCPLCRAPDVLDSSKATGCSTCGHRYPTLILTGNFGKIGLLQSATVITRDVLGGDKSVSTRHATIHRLGPEYRISDTSLNGVYKYVNAGWFRLPSGSDILRQPMIAPGDRLRFGSVEATVDRV